jgi:hypothetical protein
LSFVGLCGRDGFTSRVYRASNHRRNLFEVEGYHGEVPSFFLCCNCFLDQNRQYPIVGTVFDMETCRLVIGQISSSSSLPSLGSAKASKD